MAVGWDLPAEDELAVAVLTGLSFRIGRIFPRRTRYYDRFLTLRACSPVEVEAWVAALRWFVQKLTWRYQRPVLLKSAPHTGRIALLQRVFPGARFVHIRRDPYAVFRSTCRELVATAPFSRLQRYVEPDLPGLVLARYRALYEAFFAERSLIPEGRLHEVSFEALARDPVAELRTLYAALKLPAFKVVAPKLAAVVAAARGYRPNEATPLPADLRQRVATAWSESFAIWGYPA